MQKSLLAITTIILCSVISLCIGCDGEVKVDAVGLLIRDCSGTYFRVGGDDYKICNPEDIHHLEDHTVFQAIMSPADECSFPFECFKLYSFHSHVHLSEIRK